MLSLIRQMAILIRDLIRQMAIYKGTVASILHMLSLIRQMAILIRDLIVDKGPND